MRAARSAPLAAPEPRPGPVQVLKVAGSVIAPITLITALMYYFGVLHAFWFYGSFGVDYSVFELTAEDFIVRSADGLFFPFTVVALVVLLLTWVYQLLPVSVTVARTPVLRVVVWAGSVLGALLMAVAGLAVLRPERFLERPAVGGVCLVLGVLALLAATRAQRELHEQDPGRARSTTPVSWRVTEWTAVVLLVSVGLFWAVGDWSAASGQKRASQVVATLPGWPDVVLHSTQELNLSGPGVLETRCSGSEDAFIYRYDGLKLITQENGQLFLLPTDWAWGSGPAIVLTKVDTIRQDFHAPGTAPPVDC